MGRRGEGYGSEDHLRNYLAQDQRTLDAAVASSFDAPIDSVSWLDYPLAASGRETEYQGLNFLPPELSRVRAAWRDVWPTRGRQQTWDAVGRLGDAWLLVEAKANHPEFCSPPTTATGAGRAVIERTLGRVKRRLGVHRFFAWTGSYYQYANRLAMLWFLRDHGVDARLVGIYFIGDTFPDATPSPASRRVWEQLIDARRLTLGLPERHYLSEYERHVFLPAWAQT